MTKIMCVLMLLTSCMVIKPASYEEQVQANVAQAVLILVVCDQRRQIAHSTDPNYCAGSWPW